MVRKMTPDLNPESVSLKLPRASKPVHTDVSSSSFMYPAAGWEGGCAERSIK